MKFAIGLLISVFSTITLACPEAAQVIAKISSATAKTSKTCTVFVDPATVRVFSQNTCLDISMIDVEGVEVRRKAGFACESAKGAELNGVIYRGAEGQLILE